MSQRSLVAAGLANLGGAQTCTPVPKRCTPSDIQIAITKLIKCKFPAGTKAWAYLMDTFGLKERAAKHRLSNSVSYTVEELQVLIQGDDGLDFLMALMADARPAWWLWIQKVMKLADARRKQAEIQQEVLALETTGLVETGARRRLKGIRDADKNISSAIAGKETAVGLLRPINDRALDRPVAQTQGRRR